MQHGLQNVLLVDLGPRPDGQLRDLKGGGTQPPHNTIGYVLLWLHMSYGAREVLVPWLLDRKNKNILLLSFCTYMYLQLYMVLPYAEVKRPLR